MPKAHPSPLPNAPALPLPFQLVTGLWCPLTLPPALPLLPVRPALWPHCPCTPVKLRARRCAGRRRPQSPPLTPLSAAVSCCTLPERHEWGSLSPLPDLLGWLLLYATHLPPLPLAASTPQRCAGEFPLGRLELISVGSELHCVTNSTKKCPAWLAVAVCTTPALAAAGLFILLNVCYSREAKSP